MTESVVVVEQHTETDPSVFTARPDAPTRFRRTRLALEVLGCYARVRWLVFRHGAVMTVPILRRGLIESSSKTTSVQVSQGLRLGRVVQKVLRLLPFDGRCLMRSLVLTGMLGSRGIYARVVIGVRSAPSFAAHAWVEVDGRPLLPADEATYARLVEI